MCSSFPIYRGSFLCKTANSLANIPTYSRTPTYRGCTVYILGGHRSLSVLDMLCPKYILGYRKNSSFFQFTFCFGYVDENRGPHSLLKMNGVICPSFCLFDFLPKIRTSAHNNIWDIAINSISVALQSRFWCNRVYTSMLVQSRFIFIVELVVSLDSLLFYF